MNCRAAAYWNHELEVEFFAIGEEVDGDRFILLDRRKSAFTLTRENEKSYALSGEPVLVYAYTDYYGDRRGRKYGGYLIMVTDSRGKLIAHETSHKWLVGNYDNLEKLSVGQYFDKSCTRVFPTRPKLQY